MLLRIVKGKRKGSVILYADGKNSVANEDNLQKVLSNQHRIEKLLGEEDGWGLSCDNMEEVVGETLAWIDDDHVLHVMPDNPFKVLFQTNGKDVHKEAEEDVAYLTADEYAAEVGRTAIRVRVLCREGRIADAKKVGNQWLIPQGTPYPEDNRFVENPKRPRKKAVKEEL